ncbi:hypothetical protein HN615_09295 [Candidatus Woesearchaeota archaeon]|jgi:hypothetical protein|nr:hypothetical protein [Candidatus Woesearchaeota archaeon]
MGKVLLMGGGFVGLLGMAVVIISVFEGSDNFGLGLILMLGGFGVSAFGGNLDSKKEQKKEKEFSEKGKDDLLDKF